MSILSRVKEWVDQEVLEASDLNAEFDAIVNNIIAGTTASAGVLQLEDSHASTSTTKAACPKNVKEAYDLADTMLTKATFDANTFIYAVSDNAPIKKTRAQVMALLSGQATGSFDMNAQRVVSVDDPTGDQDAATKKYVDDNVDSHFITPGAGTLSAAATAASDGDVLWLKEGVYTETVPITITSKSLSIIGAGPDVSIIRCTGTHGIVVDTNLIDRHVTLKDFTIETTSTGTYIAIQLEGGDVASSTNKQFYVNNVIVRPYNLALDCWATGIKLIEGWNTTITDCGIRGINNDVSMTSGIELTTDCIDVTISNCRLSFMNYGIKVGLTQAEGITISNCVIIYVNYGVHCHFTNDEPWIGIMNSHISAFYYCIYFSRVHQSKIIGNLLYKRSDSSQNFVAISLATTGSHNIISSNSIHGAGTGGTEDGIVLGAGLTRNIIANNTVDGQGTGIWLVSGANNNIVDANITSSCTNEVLDQGTGNSVTDNLAI